ncbi:hypothetical protein [Candidatus Nanopusillus massiliensis]|uniref:hypothetical protein n=1 Tax=Candidatus Nanopusillus massiliensis TaxID=2897163 RepID=UPI001E534169|nr:hypothetical protein [Candidatus Nanopusillus massiliensis]
MIKAIWIVIPEGYQRELESIYYNFFLDKLKKYIEKKKYNINVDEILNFSSTISKDFFYEKYRGLASKKIKEKIGEFLERNYLIKDNILVFLVKKIVDYESSFRSGLHA